MKKKDIITVVVSVVVIGGCLYFLWGMLFPATPKSTSNSQTQTANQPQFTGNIDNSTLDQVKKLNDYGAAPLDNIGRVNPFGPLN